MSPLDWALFAACCLTCGLIGWQLRSYAEEIRVDRAERAADDAFDREYGPAKS